MKIILSLLFLLVGWISKGQSFTDKSFDFMVDQLLSHSVNEKGIEDVIGDTSAVLLDARELYEYNVSHLAGAVWVGYDDFDIERVSSIKKDRPVIVYCSVGYRSEKITEKLNEEGYENVYNLLGGIFDWVNNGHAVVDSLNNSTEDIHAFNRAWGAWLKKGNKVYGN